VSRKIQGWAIYTDEDEIKFVKKLRSFTSGTPTIVCPATIILDVDEGVSNYQDKHGKFIK